MCVRALKDEVTHVKMLYMAMFSILLSGTGMLFTPWNQTRVPSWYGIMLLVQCGALSPLHAHSFLHMLYCTAMGVGMGPAANNNDVFTVEG